MSKFLEPIELTEQASPGTPASGAAYLYAKADGRLYYKNDQGEEIGPIAAEDSDVPRITVGRIRPSNPDINDLHLFIEAVLGPTFASIDNSTTTPIISGHRGNYASRAESALGSYVANLDDFTLPNLALEADASLTADNIPVVMHDTTVDRTTNGTGNVNSFTLAGIKALEVDDLFPLFGMQESPGPLTVPTVAEVYELAKSRVLVIEPKDTPTAEYIAQLAVDLGVTDRILPNAFNMAQLTPFISRGMPAMLHDPQNDGRTPQQLKDAGLTHINWRATNVVADVAPYQAVGLKIWSGGNSRSGWSLFSGVRVGGISDDAVWVSGVSPVRTTDDFASRKAHPGHIPYTPGSLGAFVDRGDGVICWTTGLATSPGDGTQGNGWVMHGQLSPHANSRTGAWDYGAGTFAVKTPTYPWGYEMDITYLEAGSNPIRRWGIAFAPDDRPFHDTTTGATLGYGTFLHGDAAGTVYTGMKGQGSTRTSPSSAPLGGAWTIGETKRVRFRRMSASQVGITIDGGTETLATLSTGSAEFYQGGYLWLGCPGISGSTGRWGFSNVVAI